MLRKLGLLSVLSLVICGCAGFHHLYSESSRTNLIDFLYPQGEVIDHSQDRLPELKLPLKVGLAFVPEQKNHQLPSLSQAEKIQLLNQVADTFRERPFIKEIEIIPDMYLQNTRGFQGLKQIGRVYQLDVIALVSYDQLSNRGENSLSLAYLTIVGAFVVPGDQTQISTLVDTAVFDLSSEKLLFRAPGMHSVKSTHATVGANSKVRAMKIDSFRAAVDQMSENLTSELNLFTEKAKKGEHLTVSYHPGYGGTFGQCFVIFLIVLVGIRGRGEKGISAEQS